MIERFVSAILIALFGWLAERAGDEPTAKDAQTDEARLRRAGGRIRRWLRSKNRAGD